jgi:hypothetical protein
MKCTFPFCRFFLAAVAATVSVVAAQTREELVRKFNQPISETFAISSEISLTATYRADGAVSELVISPRTSDSVKSRNTTLSRDAVDLLIDDLAPVIVRGKASRFVTFLNLACLPANDCNGTSRDYEKLTIYYNAGADGRIAYAVVKWK